jgi:hypothetical protein
MLIETLRTLFNRDLNQLKKEIELYQNETDIWCVHKGIANSAGNLCIHLIGNLNTSIRVEFGKTNYIRNRALEFFLKNVPKAELLNKIEETKTIVDYAHISLTEEMLQNEYPLLVFETKMTT